MPHLAEPITVILEYSDVQGIETKRTVDVYRTAKDRGYSRITGWCHGRQAERTFRSDRVKCVITVDGEVLSAVQFLATLTPRTAKNVAMAPQVHLADTISDDKEGATLSPTEPHAAQKEGTSRIRRFGWGEAFFAVAIAPAVIFAFLFIVVEQDIPMALFALGIFGVPVLTVRWLYRKLRQPKH